MSSGFHPTKLMRWELLSIICLFLIDFIYSTGGGWLVSGYLLLRMAFLDNKGESYDLPQMRAQNPRSQPNQS